MKYNVLIVEDEILVGIDIKESILSMGYEVCDVVKNYENAISSINKNEPSIIIMDIFLKNSKDGIDTAIEIKKQKDIPIIFLTAFTDEETIKRAVQASPVGFLSKPYNLDDLKTTIQLGLYKTNSEFPFIKETSYKHLGDNYYFDLDSKELYYQERIIKLSKKEKRLIEILLDAKGSVISLEELEYQIWESKPVSSSSLRTLIYRLRTKLDYKIITTVPYQGLKI